MYSKGEGVVGVRECFECVIVCDIDLFISGFFFVYVIFFIVRFIIIYLQFDKI